MRASSQEYADSHGMGLPVASTIDVYYDGQLVVSGIPVASGSVTDDETQDVARDLGVSVPRRISLDEGITETDLLPTKDLDPLECYGQQAKINYNVTLPSGRIETFDLGLARLQTWDEEDSGEIALTGAGLLLEAQEDRLLRAVQVRRGTAFPDAARQMVGQILPVAIDEALPARSTGAFTFEEDRLAALGDLLDAWPARAYVDDQGVLQITKPYDDATDPVVRVVRDGEDGTLAKAPRGNSREGRYNGVIATGETPVDMTPVSGAAYLREGAMRWNGPFGNVPYGMSSPLLTTVAQCNAAAATRLQNLQRATRPRSLEMVPDARLQPGDIIRVESSDEPPLLLRIASIELSLTYAGLMRVSGGVLDRRAV